MSPRGTSRPSAWVERFAGLVPAGAPVLDVACGSGRHSSLFLAAGHPVTAVDKDLSTIEREVEVADLELVAADLEDGSPWPFDGRQFAGIVVTNYLYHPLFPALIRSLTPEGVLIYETFAAGNGQFGKPSNPDFLLEPGELIRLVQDDLSIVAYEHGRTGHPRPAIVQRICAVNSEGPRNL